MKRLLTVILTVCAMTQPALAERLANQLFGAMADAADGKSQAIGTYARGCAAGLVRLPETGPTWQAMRLSRNRN